jgi:hypothetical protein
MTGSDEAKPDLTERQLQIVALIARGCSNERGRRAARHLPENGEGALRRLAPEARRAETAADPAAFKALTGEDPLARELAPALAGAGG